MKFIITPDFEKMDPINKLFNNMDTWRHLPAYQLERRADIFFSIYLPEVLSDKFSTEIEGIIPEFPVHIGTITEGGTNQSFRIDYLAKSKNKIVFVELKTDYGSRRKEQDLYLEQARQAGIEKLLDGLRKIYKATNHKKKYQYLFVHLEELGLIQLTGKGSFTITSGKYEIEIVYIQPNSSHGRENIITFTDFAGIVERHGDQVSLCFAESLRCWANEKAGS